MSEHKTGGYGAGEGDIVLKRTEGWIHKKGGAVKGSALSAMKNWKKRYFYLENMGSTHTLYEMKYYDKPNGNLKGSVKLKGTDVRCDRTQQGNNAKNKKFEFQILLTNGSLMKLFCENLTERDEWVDTLNHVILEMKVKPLPKKVKKQSMKNATFSEMVEILAYNPSNEDDIADFEAGRDIANACQAFGSGLFGAEAGQNAQFMIQSYSGSGDMLDGGGLPISISLMDDECLYHIRSHDNDDGTYSAFYSVSRPGKYKLHVKLNDTHHIAGSPFDVEILPSYTVAGLCTGTGNCLTTILPEEKSVFTITARDGLGNRKRRGGDPFEIGVMGPALLHGLTDNNDGTYSCVVEAKQPSLVDYVTSASLSIMVTLHGKHISGSPFRPTIDTQRSTPSGKDEAGVKHSKQSRGENRGDGGVPPMSRRNMGAASVAGRASALSKSAMTFEQQSHSSSPSSFNTPSKREDKKPPALTQQDLLATLDSSSGSSLTKLEQARQRALQRSQNASQSHVDTGRGVDSSSNSFHNSFRTPAHGQINGLDESPPPPPPPSDSPAAFQTSKLSLSRRSNNPRAGSNSVKDRMSKLDMMTKKFGESTLSTSARGVPGGGGASKLQNRQQPSTSKVADEFLTSSAATQEDLAASFAAGLCQSSPPEDLSNESRRIWGVADEALRSPDVITTVSSNVAGMEKCFHLAADGGLAFLSPTDNGIGLYRTFEEFDVIPAYISKKELKALFNLIIRAQTFQLGKQMKGPNGKDVITFVSFLKLLVMTCLHCLAKTSAFNSLYPTVKAKLDVMLFNWGFADPLKIKAVSNRVKHRQ